MHLDLPLVKVDAKSTPFYSSHLHFPGIIIFSALPVFEPQLPWSKYLKQMIFQCATVLCFLLGFFQQQEYVVVNISLVILILPKCNFNIISTSKGSSESKKMWNTSLNIPILNYLSQMRGNFAFFTWIFSRYLNRLGTSAETRSPT